MRLLVCGGRDYYNWRHVTITLDFAVMGHSDVLLIEGGAWGADLMGHLWAVSRGHSWQTFPANWELRGKAAGFQRNTEMLTIGRPELVVAFPGGAGTADTVKKAEALNIPTAICHPYS